MSNTYRPSADAAPQSKYAGRTGLTYSRVSTKGQDGDAQELRCAQFLESAGVPLERAFSDKFTGGGDFLLRPAMRELLAHVDAARGRKFLVVFDDLKRFARDTEFHIRLRQAFRKRDVMLACLNYNFDETPEGKFAETVIAAQGQLEREQNRRQVLQKTKARLERGYWAFSHRKGYDIIKSKEHGKLCVPNAEGRVLAEALEGFASGRFSRPSDVCRFLMDKGFWPGRKGKYVEDVSRYLRDPFYCGDIEYPAWGVTRRPGHHKPLISRRTFARIQERLDGARAGKRVRQDVTDDFPLRGLVLCTGCGRHLTSVFARGRSKHYPYYYCCNRSCPRYAEMFRRADVEDAFERLLMRNRLKPDIGLLAEMLFGRCWEDEVADAGAAQAQRERRAEELRREVEQYARLARSAPSDAVRASYEAQIERAAAQLAEAEKAEAVSRDLDVPFQTTFAEAREFLENPLKSWHSEDAAGKHRLFFFLFEEKLEFHPTKYFQTGKELSATRLFEEFVGAEPWLVHSPGKTSNPKKVDDEASSRPVQNNREALNRLKTYLTKFWVHRRDFEGAASP